MLLTLSLMSKEIPERRALKDGMIILACGDQSLRFRPHLNVTREEIRLALDKIENNINKI